MLKEAQKRQLNLFGKVCIIKSLSIAKMTYVSLCLTILEEVIKEIDMRIFRFLWGKRDRIKRKSIINEIEKGGLKMIDRLFGHTLMQLKQPGFLVSLMLHMIICGRFCQNNIFPHLERTMQ